MPRSSDSVVTRFAPAPTGFLHIGHVVNALYVWALAHASGGRVRVRIEDHDRQRSRREYEDAILEDLDWLGFAADGPIVRQRDREDVYRAAASRLIEAGLVYGCTCTRAEIEVGADRPEGAELPYGNTCRTRGHSLVDGIGWRVRMEPGTEPFDDLITGPESQDPAAQCGDLLIRDRLGNWTYQFAVVADDIAQGMTHVVRGEDLRASTGRQIRLARMLGRTTPPRFAHHPLVMKSPIAKLSKSDGDTGVRELRAAGWTPERVRAHARTLAGPALPAMEGSARPAATPT